LAVDAEHHALVRVVLPALDRRDRAAILTLTHDRGDGGNLDGGDGSCDHGSCLPLSAAASGCHRGGGFACWCRPCGRRSIKDDSIRVTTNIPDGSHYCATNFDRTCL